MKTAMRGLRKRGSVLECASPLALLRARRDRKRQGTGALQDLAVIRRFMETAQVRCRSAFTLVELLVALAIIALLAALLLPALTRGRHSAQQVRCVSNLRQLGLATHMYWDDNGGACFRYGGIPTNGGQLYWFGWMGSGAEGQRIFDARPGVLYAYLQGRGVEICPALNYLSAQFKLKATTASYGYGYNLFLSAPAMQSPVNSNRLRQPAAKALLADAAQVNTWQPPASPSNPLLEEWYYVDNGTNHPNGHFRHTQKAETIFCDGHVAPERMVPGSLDLHLPNQFVGSLRGEILITNDE